MRIFLPSPYAQFWKMTCFGHFGPCACIVRDSFSFSLRIDRKWISHSAHLKRAHISLQTGILLRSQCAQWDCVVSTHWRICCMQPDLFPNRDLIASQCAHWDCQRRFPFQGIARIVIWINTDARIDTLLISVVWYCARCQLLLVLLRTM
jgi:hypothetical protein